MTNYIDIFFDTQKWSYQNFKSILINNSSEISIIDNCRDANETNEENTNNDNNNNDQQNEQSSSNDNSENTENSKKF